MNYSNKDGEINMIDLKGGPTIDLNVEIPGTDIITVKIEMNDNKQFIIYV